MRHVVSWTYEYDDRYRMSYVSAFVQMADEPRSCLEYLEFERYEQRPWLRRKDAVSMLNHC